MKKKKRKLWQALSQKLLLITLPISAVSVSKEKQWIKKQINARKKGVEFVHTIYLESELVGTLTIRPNQGHKEVAEVGYFIAEKHWGKGITTEAVKKAIQITKTEHGITGIIATTHPENVGSQRVLRKSGFRLIGELEKYMRVGGELQTRYLSWKSIA